MSAPRSCRPGFIACALYLLGSLANAGGPPVVPAEAAADHVGEYATVEGRIADVFTSDNDNTFLNFGASYPRHVFSATVFARYRSQFKDLHALEGRRVRITGQIRLYQDKPQIILESPSQLKVE
jgi:DNA/RNA endonuclease YhcR with UshA esterase domain